MKTTCIIGLVVLLLIWAFWFFWMMVLGGTSNNEENKAFREKLVNAITKITVMDILYTIAIVVLCIVTFVKEL